MLKMINRENDFDFSLAQLSALGRFYESKGKALDEYEKELRLIYEKTYTDYGKTYMSDRPFWKWLSAS